MREAFVPRVTQVPEGLDADVRPAYFVTFLSAESADVRDDFTNEETFLVEEVADCETVIAWARARVTDRVLFAEVSVLAANGARRARIWFHQPPSAWATRVGPYYTY